jgi:hypothetical protein
MRHLAQFVPCIFENITYGCQLRSDERPRRGHDCLLLEYAGLYSILDDSYCAYLLILRLPAMLWD